MQRTAVAVAVEIVAAADSTELLAQGKSRLFPDRRMERRAGERQRGRKEGQSDFEDSVGVLGDIPLLPLVKIGEAAVAVVEDGMHGLEVAVGVRDGLEVVVRDER